MTCFKNPLGSTVHLNYLTSEHFSFVIYLCLIIFHFICQLGKGSGTLGAHHNTLKGDCKKDVTGFQRVIQYVYNNPNLQCYTQFFVGGQPPTGLRQQNENNIRYICQPPSPNQQAQKTYYATMFDECLGIAVFAAYTLTQFNAVFPGNQHAYWRQTPGNVIKNPHSGPLPKSWLNKEQVWLFHTVMFAAFCQATWLRLIRYDNKKGFTGSKT